MIEKKLILVMRAIFVWTQCIHTYIHTSVAADSANNANTLLAVFFQSNCVK